MKKLLPLFLLLSGCSLQQADSSLKVINSYATLEYYYSDGSIVNYINEAELTNVESILINQAFEEVNKVQSRLKDIKKDPKKIIENIGLIAFEYSKLKMSYLSVRNVILLHEKEYSQEAWMTFVKFDGAAIILNNQFEEMLSKSESNAALLTAIRFADTIVKLVKIIS